MNIIRVSTTTAGFLLSAVVSAAAQSRSAPPSTLPFEYARSAPLDFVDSLTQGGQGYSAHRISFNSPRGGRATGILVTPVTDGKHAGIVLMHGAPGNAAMLTSFAAAFARKGAVVIALDAPFARRGSEPFALTVQDSIDQVQLIVDLRRAVDLLIARPDVDSTRLAYVGGSYGGAIGVLLSGVEPRVHNYGLFVPDGGLVEHFTEEDGTRIPAVADVSETDWKRWLRAMQPIEPLRYLALARGARFLFQNGRKDEFVSIADAERLHRAAPEPKQVEWYDSGHRLPSLSRIALMSWLSATVGTAPPDNSDRAALGLPPVPPGSS